MTEKIKEYLNNLEEERNIKILLACETGSRAWGFPSPDSDYDIRILYCHPKEWYLSLSEAKDTIDLFFDNKDIDISGWELRKSLRLMAKSNAALIERVQSPIVYKSDKRFHSEILNLAQLNYSRIATMHHYLSMARRMYLEVKEVEHFKLKKFFYALRSSIACLWILEKEEIPPIEFTKMIEALAFPLKLKERINELIELKAKCNEDYLHKGEIDLMHLMADCLKRAELERYDLPSAKGDREALDLFFRNNLS